MFDTHVQTHTSRLIDTRYGMLYFIFYLPKLLRYFELDQDKMNSVVWKFQHTPLKMRNQKVYSLELFLKIIHESCNFKIILIFRKIWGIDFL